MVNEIFTVAYSPSQRAFHIELSSEMAANSMRVFSSQTVSDYLPLGLFDSHDDAYGFMKSIMPES